MQATHLTGGATVPMPFIANWCLATVVLSVFPLPSFLMSFPSSTLKEGFIKSARLLVCCFHRSCVFRCSADEGMEARKATSDCWDTPIAHQNWHEICDECIKYVVEHLIMPNGPPSELSSSAPRGYKEHNKPNSCLWSQN
jgi:hypothetical protein